MVALLTDEVWLTMPPLPHAYQGRAAIGAFYRGAEERRGTPLRLLATRANTQLAFGCYLPASETGGARAFSLFVLTLEGGHISAITWFAGSDILPRFGLPRQLPEQAGDQAGANVSPALIERTSPCGALSASC